MCVSLAANNPSVVSCRKCCGALNASSGFSPSHSRLSKGFLSAQVFLLSRGLLKGPLLGAKILASSRHAKFCWNDLFMSAGMRCASNHQQGSLKGLDSLRASNLICRGATVHYTDSRQVRQWLRFGSPLPGHAAPSNT